MTTTPQTMNLIHVSGGFESKPNWSISSLDHDSTLIRFHKAGRINCLLDRVARWTPDGWDQTRWVPKPPIVPQGILRQVEGKLRQQQEAQQ